MYDTILVPTDASRGAEAAVDRALDLARRGGATVHALFVVPPVERHGDLDPETAADLREHAEGQGRAATIRIRERAADVGPDVVRAVREGLPHAAIQEYAREQDVDLVVMGTHGRTGRPRARLGSTTERVIAHADVPVMSVRFSEDSEVPPAYRAYDRVLIPTDGSDAAGRAVEYGLDIAEKYGADVHAVYVVDEGAYDPVDVEGSVVGLLKEGGEKATASVAAAADRRNLPATPAVVEGTPHEKILDYADGTSADLVVMGTRGMGGTPKRVLGSVTARVVRRAEIPVLTVT